MLKKDQKMLAVLVKEYSMQDILTTLVQVARDQADEYSDMGMKEKARDLLETVDLLGDIRDVV